MRLADVVLAPVLLPVTRKFRVHELLHAGQGEHVVSSTTFIVLVVAEFEQPPTPLSLLF